MSVRLRGAPCITPIEHIYALVRSPRQLERALTDIEAARAAGMQVIAVPDAALAIERVRAVLFTEREGGTQLDMSMTLATPEAADLRELFSTANPQ